jgi:hypothetical protein
MRSLVLALVLAVGPLGPAVCDVACAFDDAAPDHDVQRASVQPSAGESAICIVASDHDCPHLQPAPAVTTALLPMFSGLTAADLSGTAAQVSAESLVAGRQVGPVAWSPPHLLRQLPLRI